MSEEISLAEILNIIHKWRKLLYWLVGLALFFALLVSLLLPKEYKTQSLLLPLDSGTGSLSQALGGVLGGGNMPVGNNKLIIILKSKTLSKGVIGDLKLLPIIYSKKWDGGKQAWRDDFVPNLDSAADFMLKIIDVEINKDGALQFSFIWPDAEMSARITNTYISKLSDYVNNHALGVAFQIIDPATPPRKAFKPRILLNLLLAFIGASMLGLMGAFVAESLGRQPPKFFS